MGLFSSLVDMFSPPPAPTLPLRTRNAGPFGDAGWSTWQELLDRSDTHLMDVFQSNGIVNDGIYLGRAVFWETPLDQPFNFTNSVYSYRGENNIVTVAPSGSGKGTCAIIPTLLSNQESAFVLDVKGTNFIVTARIRQYRGHRIIMLNPFNLWGRELGFPNVVSARFNPLHDLRPDDPAFASNINGLASALIILEGKDPHWCQRARELIACLMAHVCSDPVELAHGNNTLPRIREILAFSPQKLSDYLIAAMANPIPLVRNNAGSLSGATDEIRSIISTAIGQLNFLDDPAIVNFLSASDFNFRDIRRQPMTVYCMIPPREIDTYYRFVRLMVQSLFDSLAVMPQADDRRVLVVLDEQAKLRHMEILETSAALLREYRVRIWSVFQDLNQLKGIYGNSWETFLSNAGAVQFYTPNDHTTAEYISKRIGNYTARIETKSLNTGSSYSQGGSSGSQSASSNYSNTQSTSVNTNISLQGFPFMTMQDVLGLRADFGIVFLNEHKYPVLVSKNPYHQDNWFKPANEVGGCFYPNPYREPDVLIYDPSRHSFDWRDAFKYLIENINFVAKPIIMLTQEQLADTDFIPRLARESGVRLPALEDHTAWEARLSAQIAEALNDER